ncbi:MAG: efflux RND transporter permease subunit [Sneathiella sp.]|nr:efflux RND transporter permease subunit [Sneathiella sp.]
MAPVMQRIQTFASGNIAQARVQVKPMSQGGSEAGKVEYRIIGDDADILVDAARRLEAQIRKIPGTINIKDDWENRLIKLIVKVDQARARRAGVTSQSIANALDSILSGSLVTDFREGDTIIPIYLRAEGDVRTNIDRLRTLNIATVEGAPVPLLQVADFDGVAEFSMIQRRNLERVVTVSAKHSATSLNHISSQIITPNRTPLNGIGPGNGPGSNTRTSSNTP